MSTRAPAAGRVLHLGAAAHLHATVSARFVVGFVWGAVLILCIAIVPMEPTRARQRGHQCRATKIRRRFSENA